MEINNTMECYNVLYSPRRIYQGMISDIKRAKKEILLETYIYSDDKIGRQFRSELIKKALNGVKVKLLIDSWGSNVRKKFFKKLIDAGGEIRFFRELKYVWRFFTVNHERNHRKLLLIDEKISYIGSINITNRCINWEELVLRTEGPLTLTLKKSFNETWKRFNFFSKKRMRKIIYKGFEILQDAPSGKIGLTGRRYINLISHAKKDILIVTPYLVPSKKIRNSLKRAIRRGVRVRILFPRFSDLKYLDIFRNRYLGKLYRMGVEMYYYPKNLHSKCLVVDNDFFLLGSSNLDYRSFMHQFEINLLGKNKNLLMILRKHFEKNIKLSKKFNYNLWIRRHIFSKFRDWSINKIISPYRNYL